MRISRRRFVGDGAVCMGGFCVPVISGLRFAEASSAADVLVFDLQCDCVLPESLQGYREAIGAASVVSRTDDRHWQGRCRLAIFPGAGNLSAATVSIVLELLKAGTIVLLESGGGYLDADEVASQRQTLRSIFDVNVADAIDVRSGNGQVPYICCRWPRELLVRDFSRALPMIAQESAVIGRIGALPVAIKKRIGNGILIVLGSPFGPALRAGDLEARAWVQSLACAI